MNPIELSLFSSRIDAICEEMGAVLRRSALSPNIRDRLDFSCALFDASGELCAQAAHIPVHLGSMAYAMRDLVERIEWQHGDMVILNDPFLGGTHLPDVTLIAPLFLDGELIAFVANRAHHADIGASTPGSMPISSHLDEEGIVIPPSNLFRRCELDRSLMDEITIQTRNPRDSEGDLTAQISANRAGLQRLERLVESLGSSAFSSALVELNDYAQRLVEQVLVELPDGTYRFSDVMDDDGQDNFDLKIAVTLQVAGSHVHLNFSDSAAQVEGNINCPLSVAAAAVYYAFRCLMPPQTPACAGAFRAITLEAPEGSLLNARRPAAVAAGNVETSTRVVDVVLGALALAIPDRIPAASHGTMNNLAMGSDSPGAAWDYYETIGGGMGAGRNGGGLSGVQTHMTNTLNTPIEVLEMRYPLQVTRHGLRENSAGSGLRPGGEGLVREYRFLAPASATLLTERRRHRPWGIAGGDDGAVGENRLNGEALPSKVTVEVKAGDLLEIKTPGGGGYGGPS
ncbi:5-oxoprolinase [Solemya pervernicosa gill symbiont]|uniref:5-oxoprolinase n=2 Tax=Gammaproteobacteria incertae sedis TaxID=118884 RepID=A0A1T2L4P8_9GAMM|nr:hydantoinase B/oxoprolinase family protein [Candidatus Reidiella endopervernicosa]OOZ40069.1 5-oxoprolinase [Solemya pervernicosa gill symbiont]QKQ27634.1 hydantoinase B/oxoprolinase family protein [Candidatus Reidiella endopervernicosa]